MTSVTIGEVVPHFRQGRLVTAPRGVGLPEINRLMVFESVSRVPIIQGRTCHGIVRMRRLFDRMAGEDRSPAVLDDVMDAKPPEVDYSTPLFDAVAQLRTAKELLVRDRKGGEFTKLLTPRALAYFLAERARPFLVIEELERTLRDLLRRHEADAQAALASVRADEADHAAATGKSGHTPNSDGFDVDALNPRDYAALCTRLHPKLDELKAFDADETSDLLRRFATHRNDVMHFREPRSADFAADLDRFARLARWLQDRASASAKSPPA